MKKVIHLMSTHVFSGAENVACQIINSFKEDENYEMIYVSEIKDNKKNLDDRKINYYKLDKFNFKNIKLAIEKIKPDIIHAHDIKASIIAGMFSKKVKIISHVHANHENMRKINLKTLLFNLSSKNIDRMIWVSQSALDNYKFKNNIIDKSTVLYNVIDVKEIEEKAKKDTKDYKYDLIYLGRLVEQKDPLRLINLIKKVVDIEKNTKVAIVGSGMLEDKVKKSIEINNLSNNVDFFGFVTNPYKILLSSKIMIMTSKYEGTPMCALEAIAFGKPIITTPTDGLKDIIKNDEMGYVTDEDNVLVDKIVKLLNNQNDYCLMTKNIIKESARINDLKQYKEKIETNYKC